MQITVVKSAKRLMVNVMSTESADKPEKNRPRFQLRRVLPIMIVLAVLAIMIAWQYGLFPGSKPHPRDNTIMTIAPYRYNGTWVFDDSSVGLIREPFVAGVPEMIDVLAKDIPNADNGFRLLFSAKAFPGYQKKLVWLRGDSGGNYYELDDPPMEGWICPAMFKYYSKPPMELYVRAEEIE